MGRLTFIILFFVILPHAQAAKPKPKWGKVICTHVTQDDAVKFAHESVFLENWDYNTQPEPPYVAPIGSLSCTLPMQVQTIANEGGTAFQTTVYFIDQPYKLPACEVKYFDGSKTRHFKVHGGGDGFFDLIGPDSGSMSAYFDDFNQHKYQTDEFMITNVGRKADISWAGEARDDHKHMPIVTNCHAEF